MEHAVEAQLTPGVLADAAARFGTAPDALAKLGDFENYVYAFEQGGQGRVLRLTHSSHRILREVRAELHWLNFLAAANLGVARPFASERGELVEEVHASGSAFFVSAFERAEGERLTRAAMTPGVLRTWGALLGSMHAATRAYVPEDPQGRPTWRSDPYVRDRRHFTHLVGEDVMARFDAVVTELERVPMTPGTFGLIHSDAHPGNFLVRNEWITLFDFDDCMHHFFVQDLAMALYYAMWDVAPTERDAFGTFLFAHLLEGYREHRAVSPEELRLVPALLKLREVIVYVLMHRKLDLANLTERQRAFLRSARERVLLDMPIVNVNFEACGVVTG